MATDGSRAKLDVERCFLRGCYYYRCWRCFVPVPLVFNCLLGGFRVLHDCRQYIKVESKMAKNELKMA